MVEHHVRNHGPSSGHCTSCSFRHGRPIDRGRVQAEKRLSLSYTAVGRGDQILSAYGLGREPVCAVQEARLVLAWAWAVSSPAFPKRSRAIRRKGSDDTFEKCAGIYGALEKIDGIRQPEAHYFHRLSITGDQDSGLRGPLTM